MLQLSQQPSADSAPSSSSAVETDDMHDATFIDGIIESYAAELFFADEKNTAGMSLTEGLVEGRSQCHAKFCNTKRLVLQAMHDHPLAGHLRVTNTTNAINSRLFWRNAHQEVRKHIRHCPSCQLQTSNPSKPTGLLQPLDVPPFAWHTVTTDYITGLPVTADGHNAIAVFVDKLTRYVYVVSCIDTSDSVDWANLYVQHV